MPNLTNLLPEDRRRALAREYLLRLVALVGAAASVLVLIHAALLAPSYIYLSEEVTTRTEHLSDISALAGSSQEGALGERSAKVEADAQALSILVSLPAASPVIEDILALPRFGVSITGLSVTPSLEGGEAKMSVSGIASTRETLRRYYQALSALPFVASAHLPLSVYASEAEIPFTIALTGTLP